MAEIFDFSYLSKRSNSHFNLSSNSIKESWISLEVQTSSNPFLMSYIFSNTSPSFLRILKCSFLANYCFFSSSSSTFFFSYSFIFFILVYFSSSSYFFFLKYSSTPFLYSSFSFFFLSYSFLLLSSYYFLFYSNLDFAAWN